MRPPRRQARGEPQRKRPGYLATRNVVVLALVAGAIAGAATLLPATALGLGPDGAEHATQATAYTPHPGVTYHAEANGYYMDWYRIANASAGPGAPPLIVHFSNETTDLCEAGPEETAPNCSPGSCFMGYGGLLHQRGCGLGLGSLCIEPRPLGETCETYGREGITGPGSDHCMLGGGANISGVTTPGCTLTMRWYWGATGEKHPEVGYFSVSNRVESQRISSESPLDPWGGSGGWECEDGFGSLDPCQPMPYSIRIDPEPGLGYEGGAAVEPPRPSPDETGQLFSSKYIFNRELKNTFGALSKVTDEASQGSASMAGMTLLDFAFDAKEAAIEFVAGKVMGAIANDPPARRYREMVGVRRLHLQAVRVSGSVTRTRGEALDSLLKAQALVASYSQAMLLAFERFKGAQLAGSRHWEDLQLRSLSRYAGKFASAIGGEIRSRVRAAGTLRTLGYARAPISAKRLAALRRLVARHGLPARLEGDLGRVGLSATERRVLARAVARDDEPLGDLVTQLTNQRSLSELRAVASGARVLEREARSALARG